jgi:orotidine-5'-phosphate decarboxylase
VSNSRIIVPLDFSTSVAANRLVDQLTPDLCRLKVGKELFTSCGPSLVENYVNKGFDVFLDLKFHDIPHTVARASVAAAKLGVWMLNVHASGGSEMMLASREAIDKASHQPLLIGVTVLTSMSAKDLAQVGVHIEPGDQVIDLANLCSEAGLDGVVCSAQEVSVLRKKLGDDFLLVTPGIRPAGSSKDDQKRIMTPAEAINAGSDYLVIGRPITQADDPLEVLQAINNEVACQEERNGN